MSHTALARTYRPRRFSEVTAQEHVSETLRRAVTGGRVGHAYLFCGPRGVGKTTLARVLAMSLNCPARGADGEPCGECDSCSRIWSGTTSLDVIEIDAASNRGVDDARELRERAMYAPSEEGRFKIYILDEAHMLTREAWNALLKILEEPPSRVIFIFATTEPQKIEQTAAPILSRCQRFDFRRVGSAEIVARLGEILEREGLQGSEEALRVIARKADGGMRDGLSILDQVLALSDGVITPEAVARVLGVVEEDRYFQLFDLLAARERGGLFILIEELLDQGYDLVEFYHGLMEGIRTLLRLRVGGGGSDLPQERRTHWEEKAALFEPGELVRMLGMAAELETGGSLRRTSNPRVLLELLLLRFSYLDRTVELRELIDALGGDAPMGALSKSASPARESVSASSKASSPSSESRSPVPRGESASTPASSPQSAESSARYEKTPAPAERQREDRPKEEKKEVVRKDGPLLAAFKEKLGEAEESGRITMDEARAGRLQDLMEKEPGLRPAVEELDLELLD